MVLAEIFRKRCTSRGGTKLTGPQASGPRGGRVVLLLDKQRDIAVTAPKKFATQGLIWLAQLRKAAIESLL